MKSDEDFLKELRSEVAALMSERGKSARAKLAFIVSLLALGSSSIGTVNTLPLLYLVPFVGYLFDLHVLAYDFGVKRAGLFIMKSPAAAPQEILWEEVVRKHRDPFSRWAGPSGSLVVLIASFVSLSYHCSIGGSLFVAWLTLNVLAILLLWVYGQRLVHRLKQLDEDLEKAKARTAVADPSG